MGRARGPRVVTPPTEGAGARVLDAQAPVSLRNFIKFRSIS